jgi:hypothetical protein
MISAYCRLPGDSFVFGTVPALTKSRLENNFDLSEERGNMR